MRFPRNCMSENNKVLYIDNIEVEFKEGQTILEAARNANIYIPTLCYIDGLTPHGGCRLCIVKVEGMRGFPPSCATPAQEGMNVITDDDEIQDLRREIMKLILSEHPYSCIVCENRENCELERGGLNKFGRMFGCYSCAKKDNCELREIVSYLKIDEIHYDLEYKNHSLQTNNPFIDQDHNLCVLCGKCVRICNELRGIGAINFMKRGHDTNVSTAFDLLRIDTNCMFCGACVDICPTGALTSKNDKWNLKTDNYEISKWSRSFTDLCNVLFSDVQIPLTYDEG